VSGNVLPQPDTIIFMLRISNLGRSAAERLRLTLDQDIHQFGEASEEKNLRNLSAFSSEIPTLAPGGEIWFYLGTSIQVFGGGTPKPIPQAFSVTAQYEWANRKYHEVTAIDMRAYYGTALIMDRQTEALKDIAKAIQQIPSPSP
jgi:hypothetical protein